MFPRAFRIASVAGIDVRVDPSWLLIAALVVWSFATRFAVQGRPGATVLVMAALASAGFFLSLLGHELAHAVEARHRGLRVAGVTLFLFGGVTEMTSRTERARDEFAIAAVGPWASIVLAAVLGLVTAGLDEFVPAAAAVSDVTGVLAWLNLGLGLFNLVPGAPLDGGRVLRSAVWGLTKDPRRATRVASGAGQAVALALWGLGAWTVVQAPEALLSAAWFGFIGLFMWRAAVAERAQFEALRLIEGHRAGLLVSGEVRPSLSQDLPLGVAEPQLTAAGEIDTWRVVGDDGELVGALLVSSVQAVAPLDRGFRTVRDVMLPVASLPHVDHEEPLLTLVERLRGERVIAVTMGEEVAALVDQRQAEVALRRIRQLLLEPGEALPPSPATPGPPPPTGPPLPPPRVSP